MFGCPSLLETIHKDPWNSPCPQGPQSYVQHLLLYLQFAKTPEDFVPEVCFASFLSVGGAVAVLPGQKRQCPICPPRVALMLVRDTQKCSLICLHINHKSLQMCSILDFSQVVVVVVCVCVYVIHMSHRGSVHGSRRQGSIINESGNNNDKKSATRLTFHM